MYQEEFNKIVSNPAQLLDMDMVDVRSMSERYPYCQIAHIFYAKKLHDINNLQFENQLKKASIAVYDRNVLYEFIEKTNLQKPIHAGFEEELEKPEAIVSNFGQKDHDDKGPVLEEVVIQPVEENIETVEREVIETQLQEEILSLSSDVVENEQITEEIIPIKEELEPEFTIPEPELSETEISEQESELIMQEFIQSIPELISENQNLPESNIEEEAATEEIAEVYEESAIEAVDQATDLVENPESDPLKIDMDGMLSMEDEEGAEDELIFDLPPYDIEFELGPLPDEQKINITIQRPVFEENVKDEEVFADSFVGWLNRLGGGTKVNLVQRNESNRPIRLYSKKQENEEITPFQKQPEKVVDELIAGELAKKSIQADEHLITETYARILVMQGKYQKAVEMYSKLSLLKPQKSDYFAALIDQLKKRIK